MVQAQSHQKATIRPPVHWAAAASEQSIFFTPETCRHGLTSQRVMQTRSNTAPHARGSRCPRGNTGQSDLGYLGALVLAISDLQSPRTTPLNVFLLRGTAHLLSPVSSRGCTRGPPACWWRTEMLPVPARKQNLGFLPLSSLKAHRLTSNRKFKKTRSLKQVYPGGGGGCSCCCLRDGP